MMVEGALESSQDFGASAGAGMAAGALPLWKRELLQRRAARARPAPLAPPPPPPPPPLPPLPPSAPPPLPPAAPSSAPSSAAADEDEELRYGPGIVKRLKSRYLSLALRDAPRRRPSVLRRAASLEHLLDERPPPAPRPPAARAARPASLAQPGAAPLAARRDLVKRARSVDALSRLEPREEPAPVPAPPPAPCPRAARPPRRPAPLLRETERPPPDVVRSTLRKFEPTPARRAARPLPPRASDEPDGGEPVSRAVLDSIARAGSSTRYSFEAHLPPLAAANPVLLGRARRVGVIRPMPAPALELAVSAPAPPPEEELPAKRADTPPPAAEEPDGSVQSAEPVPTAASPPRAGKRSPPPSALVEPQPRAPPSKPEAARVLTNGHAEPAAPIPRGADGGIRGAQIERAWSAGEKPGVVAEVKLKEGGEARSGAPWARGGTGAGARRGRAPPAATSVVFNFSARAEVPDYIENDGLVLRAARRDRLKAGDPGVVVLRGRADSPPSDPESGSEPDAEPEPCAVRFLNDNVLINGRSSMPAAPDRERRAKLKLQFDDSMTRTFEYPSETSLEEDASPAAASPTAALLAEAAHLAPLASNTHMASATLARYTPSKTCADAFQLGVTRHAPPPPPPPLSPPPPPPPPLSPPPPPLAASPPPPAAGDDTTAAGTGGEAGDARPCGADAARTWSDARAQGTDLLF